MRLAALVATAALVAAPSVFAAEHQWKAEIPFSFHVGAKAMPAGSYEFKIGVREDMVQVQGGSPRTAAEEIVITRLAANPHPGPNQHSHIVFDKVGGTYTLSELWSPDIDGFLVHTTKEKHEHHVIHVTN
jgi:hypothetical protein